MRTAIFALTPPAAALANRLSACMDEGAGTARFFTAHLKPQEERLNAVDCQDPIHYFVRLSAAVREAFSRYDALLFIMATGIVVRTIAPLVTSKLSDPAILVFDERGKHAISLLSGHLGGANALARRLAAAIGADPVITTATDAQGITAPDALAAKLGLRPMPKAMIQETNGALLAGASFPYQIEEGLLHRAFYRARLTACGIGVQDAKGKSSDGALRVVLANKAHGAARTLYLVPRRLIAGIGCRSGTSKHEILSALTASCARIDVPLSRVDAFASTAAKRAEQGLLAAAEECGCTIQFYENQPMREMIEAYGLMESPFVKRTIGIGNVCEAAALCCAGTHGGRFALGKTKFEKVTVALLWEK